MPIAFTREEQECIRKKLRNIALTLVVDTPVRKITVEQLTREAGISKGAFYKFYASKERLFYELLRQLHAEIYTPALKILTDGSTAVPADALCDSIVAGYQALDSSAYKRFWLEDSRDIMKFIPEEEQQGQHQAESDIFRAFFARFGALAVSEELAFDAVRGLIATVYSKKLLEPNYETILRWMAQGVCNHIFA